MNKKTVIWLVIGVAVIGLAVLGLTTSPSGGTKEVDAAAASEAIRAGAKPVDVRTPGEFELGHLPGAISAPVDQLQSSAQNWDREAVYVVYCATGSRSATAVQLLEGMGFKNIRHFSAGMQAWTGDVEKGTNSGGKIDTGGKPTMVEFYTDT